MSMDERVRNLREDWERELRDDYEKKLRFTLPQYKNESGIELKYAFDRLDVADIPPEMPGQYPYTRGIRALGYQYMPWMIQMLHGYGTSEETRGRTNFLLKEGMRGYREEQPVILIEVDPVTTVGMDPDDPKAFGAVGLGGPSISTLEDLDNLLNGYDLKKTRFAPNTRFACLPMLALYIVYAEQRGYKPGELNGQSQNDPLTRWITTDIGGPTPSTQFKMRMELIKYCSQNMPRWNHTNLCGYLYGETCASPAQELGIVMAEAIETIEAGIKAGLDPDSFVSRFSSQVHITMNFFEEIAKLRAWRKIWAKTMKERFHCQDSRSLQYRMHVHTGGSSLTMEQPLNNIVRSTLQILASVLSGVQSLHTCSYDEAIGLPSEDAVRTAIRANQVILHETDIPYVSDPLGGSYYIEWLTNKIENEAVKVISEIENRGGFHKCVEDSWLRRLLEEQMLKWRQQVDSEERTIVGLNKFKSEEKMEVPPFVIKAQEAAETAIKRVKKWKANRDNTIVKKALDDVKDTMQKYDSVEKTGVLMPVLLEAARAKCTLGEMMGAIYEVTGGRVYASEYGRR
ncbi:MAG: acyl-CoA mutase large subunit family protein [Chloroflexota bacterium]|nr:acyl-CoA mutase large subunit family protein [Chloroflexota bacterium]